MEVMAKSSARLLLLLAVLVLGSGCPEDKTVDPEVPEDMREIVVWNLGEPDEIQTGGDGATAYYYYFYDNAELNLVYVFMKSEAGNWEITNTYLSDYHFGRTLYHAPSITHTPVSESLPGVDIPITAIISDDVCVENATLCYWVPGAPDSTEVVMSLLQTDSTYTATIPAEQVTGTGIEYFITATDNDSHTSRLPKLRGCYTLTIPVE